MYTNSNNNEIYIGRNAGRDLINDIKNAKSSIKIVSPYLSPDYIKQLVYLNDKGVDITLITSDNLETSKVQLKNKESFTHHDVIKQNIEVDKESLKKRNRNIRFSLIIFTVSFFITLLGFFSNLILLNFGIICVIFSIVSMLLFMQKIIYLYSYYPYFKLRVFYSKGYSEYLIHSKIFVIDDKIAYLGSTNYTYSGCNVNYESSIKTTDFNAVKMISQEVDYLFNNNQLRYKDISEWGKTLYYEHPHEKSYLTILRKSLFTK